MRYLIDSVPFYSDKLTSFYDFIKLTEGSYRLPTIVSPPPLRLGLLYNLRLFLHTHLH